MLARPVTTLTLSPRSGSGACHSAGPCRHHPDPPLGPAVERATVLARFLEPAVVRQGGPALQPSLAHVFSYLIHAVDDLSAAVAQKVQLYMETIPDGGIRVSDGTTGRL